MQSAIFTLSEIKWLEKSPEALRLAADCSDVSATEASAIDPVEFAGCVEFSEARAKELRAMADKIEKDW